MAYLGLQVSRHHARSSSGKIPTGVGLAIGGLASIGLWAGIGLGLKALFF